MLEIYFFKLIASVDHPKSSFALFFSYFSSHSDYMEAALINDWLLLHLLSENECMKNKFRRFQFRYILHNK